MNHIIENLVNLQAVKFDFFCNESVTVYTDKADICFNNCWCIPNMALIGQLGVGMGTHKVHNFVKFAVFGRLSTIEDKLVELNLV